MLSVDEHPPGHRPSGEVERTRARPIERRRERVGTNPNDQIPVHDTNGHIAADGHTPTTEHAQLGDPFRRTDPCPHPIGQVVVVATIESVAAQVIPSKPFHTGDDRRDRRAVERRSRTLARQGDLACPLTPALGYARPAASALQIDGELLSAVPLRRNVTVVHPTRRFEGGAWW